MSQGASVLCSGRVIACGGIHGQISLRDPRTLRVEQTVDAYSGGPVYSIDLKDTLMAVCGQTPQVCGSLMTTLTLADLKLISFHQHFLFHGD
jgi:hypothetical protein